jgi:glutamate carboxypeptidase
VLLTGHYDTVFPADTPFRETRPRPDGALNGPGIADMKGGVSVLLAALEAFEGHPEATRLGYRVLLSPDEETGSLGSAALLTELAGEAHLGFTYEPALADGELVSARKGSGNFHVVVRGRTAHAGRDFDRGRNAVVRAAAVACALADLSGAWPDVTVNVARIEGGAPLNAVPDLAILRLNVRYPDPAIGAKLLTAMRDLVGQMAGEGVSAELYGGFHRPAKPFNLAQDALFAAVRAAGALIGQEIRWAPSGGVCEGNNLFAAGLPGVDTLGVRGGDIHSDAEFAWPESFLERARLSALLLAKLATGEIDGPRIRAAMADAASAATRARSPDV